MKGAKRARAKVGDVFQIPLDDLRVGYGQVLAGRDVLFMAIFEPLFGKQETPPLDELVKSTPLFLSDSLDGKIWYGHWPIVGSYPVDLSNKPFPVNILTVGDSDDLYVEAYDRSRRRLATREEAETLLYRTTVAPVRLEQALKAYHRLAPWSEDYEPLLYSSVERRSRVVV